MSEESAHVAVDFGFDIGTLVVVAYRIIVGKPNKPGGVGRVKSRVVVEGVKLYCVAYVLGGKEENIEEFHISLAAQQIAPRERKKAEVYEPDVAPSPKRRKVVKKTEEKEKPTKKRRTDKKPKAGSSLSAGSSSCPGYNNDADLSTSYIDPVDSESEDDIVEEEKISDEVYELAVVIYHEARRRDDDGETEIDLNDIKNKFQLVSSAADKEAAEAAAAGDNLAEDEDERMVVTEQLFQDALTYLTEQNKIMVCDTLLYFI